MTCSSPTRPCGCCQDTELRTPESRRNAPGRRDLRYRVGTHASFRATMLAQLPRLVLPGELGPVRSLAALTTRAEDDPAIALLDVWATLADVLTFYQERIADEGYLATAKQRRSLLELARLVGYRPRPGVAADVHLAFTVEGATPLDLPAGTRVQSVPEPGAAAQTFETLHALPARAEWSALRPRRRRPLTPTAGELGTLDALWLEGNHAGLRRNDPLLLVLHEDDPQRRVLQLRRVAEAVFEPGQPEGVALSPDRTRVDLQVPDLAARERRVALRLLRRIDEALAELPTGTTASALRIRLADLQAQLRSDPHAALLGLRDDLLPQLRRQHAGMPPQFTVLRPWLEATTGVLERALAEVPDLRVAAAALPSRRAVGGESGSALIGALLEPPSRPPGSPLLLGRDVSTAFGGAGDAGLRVLTRLQPDLAATLYPALRAADLDAPGELAVYALTQGAPLFGHNAARIPTYEVPDDGHDPNQPDEPEPPEGPIITSGRTVPGADAVLLPPDRWAEWPLDPTEDPGRLHLDQAYDELSTGYAVVLRADEADPRIFAGVEADAASRSAYGLAGRSSRLALPAGARWYDDDRRQDLGLLRGVTVLAGSVRLPLADAPISGPVEGDVIELEQLYEGLEAGRWLIVRGERELPGSAVETSEVAMLAAVEQDVATTPEDGAERTRPGERLHSTLRLAVPLAYRYRRETVRVHANVAVADHGEGTAASLGSSDGRSPLQRFEVPDAPVTHVPAPTPAGVESSLEVRVNDVRWQPAPHLAAMAPDERSYATERDDGEATTVVFGDGERGAVPPGGSENVTARYRVGLGRQGNVAAGSLTLLKDRPLGVRDVVNPLPASGGADPDTIEQVRRNAPLAISALGRLVSLQDHADFARSFAGIGRAVAVLLPLGRRGTVHLTLAGHEDAPLDPGGLLLANLRAALQRHGDPRQPLSLLPRALLLLVVHAGVRRHPDHLWEVVEPALRAALLDAFGFERRELAQPVHASEVLAVSQAVRGVDWVDLDVLGAIGEADLAADPLTPLAPGLLDGQPRPGVPARSAGLDPDRRPRPAELLLLHPDLPETLLLTEIP